MLYARSMRLRLAAVFRAMHALIARFLGPVTSVACSNVLSPPIKQPLLSIMFLITLIVASRSDLPVAIRVSSVSAWLV